MTSNKNEYMKKYRKTDAGKAVAKRWWLSDKAKLVCKKYRDSEKGKATWKKYVSSEKRKSAEKRYEQSPNVKAYRQKYHASEQAKLLQKIWKKTEKGKLKTRRMDAKRRRLGFNIVYENIIDESSVWHHINDNDVIAVPKDIHSHFNHCSTDVHRENLIPIIEQLYPNLIDRRGF